MNVATSRAVEALPMFGFGVDGEIVGFLSLKTHTPVAAEAYVLGVKEPDWLLAEEATSTNETAD